MFTLARVRPYEKHFSLKMMKASFQQSKSQSNSNLKCVVDNTLLVSVVGLEPTRDYSRQILSLLRLPITPH